MKMFRKLTMTSEDNPSNNVDNGAIGLNNRPLQVN